MTNNYIIVKGSSGTHRVAYESILYVAVTGHYCEVYTALQVYTIRCKLMDLMETRDRYLLLQVHRSFAVNMQVVTGYSRKQVFIRNHRVPLSRAYYKIVAEQFDNST